MKEVFSMREIKFRAWLKKENKMVEVKSLHLGTRKIIYGYSETSQCYGNKSCSFDDIELMQCTDIKDRNGKEIYEGDIFHCGDTKILYIVVWNDNGFEGKQVKSSSYCGLEYWKNKIEVIGNIYENSELLEV